MSNVPPPSASIAALKGKRFLVLSSLYPPDVLGGAEMSAHNLAQWLKAQGVEVGVLTTAKTRREICAGKEENGIKIWRVWMPRPYPMYHYAKAKFWQKPLWHFLDHFDPRNRAILARVLDAFQPYHVNIHILQGLGYNMLAEIGKRKIHTTFFLHDLGLACIRMAMFKKGRECAAPCGLCTLSARYKARLAAQVPQLGYCSPSRANLEKLARYFPVKTRPHAVIMNPNKYPSPTALRAASDVLRILYVGRLHASKGIAVLLEAAAAVAENHAVTVTVVGSGPDEAALRALYAQAPWCDFTGFIGQTEISNLMINSDVLCIPSIWLENSPGVVIHALSLGLPVIGSDKGGIPELVEDGKNGLLFATNDVGALRRVIERILQEPAVLENWRAYALSHRYQFDQDYLGRQILDLLPLITAE
jgi:glycosyltransferase involved in cell wall biosynthesis